MKIIKEFKEFAVRGNVIDLAVGVVIGAAFNKIVSSLVSDIITPALGLAIGGVDFKDLQVILKEGAEGKDAVALSYGVFLQAIFDFVIVAWAIFIVVKLINRLKRTEPPPPAPPPPPSPEVLLLGEIRDVLKARP